MKIKKIHLILFSFFTVFSIINNLYSQDTIVFNLHKEPELKKGEYALVFELGTIFGYSNFFEAFSLTAKKHLRDDLALRFSVGFNMDEQNGDAKDIDESGNVLRNTVYNHNYLLQTSVNVQYFITISSKIKPFVSIGPYAEYTYYNSSDVTYASKHEEWGIGAFASFGLEMFIMDNISLIGEYVIKATYGKNLYKNWTMDNSNVNESYSYFTEYKIKLNTARLGFSVYF